MRDFLKVMKALSDPSRVEIVKQLQFKSLCVSEIYRALGLAQPTVSKHLKIAEDAGLVVCNKSGLWVNYSLADGNTSRYAATLLGNLKHWLQDEPEIARVRAILLSIRGEGNRLPCFNRFALRKRAKQGLRVVTGSAQA